MRTKIYDDKDIVIYAKKDVYVGEEADLGDALIQIGLINWGKFSEHLTEDAKKDFWDHAKLVIYTELEDVMNRFI